MNKKSYTCKYTALNETSLVSKYERQEYAYNRIGKIQKRTKEADTLAY